MARFDHKIIDKLLRFKEKNLTDRQFLNIVAAIVGLTVGFSAVILKNSVYLIQNFLKADRFSSFNHYAYFILPIIGIFLVVVFVKYILKKPIWHGIPNVLYSIAESRGFIKKHNMFSSIFASSITVGFGGSVGLEGPTVATGAAYGSTIGIGLKLTFKQVVLILGAACASSMAAIFKAPLAGVVFAMEVIMIDLTIASIIPLLIASVTAVLTSYFFMGSEVLYDFHLKEMYEFNQIPYFILLGVFTGLVSVYFTKVYIATHRIFHKLNSVFVRLLIGGSLLGTLIYLFPILYGEGYEIINQMLNGNSEAVYSSSLFTIFGNNPYLVFAIILAIILTKSFATSLTFAAGGIGGIFAPTLFNGAITGLLFSVVFNFYGIEIPASNFALVGMAGTIAGVLQAPLTAIFLIAEISGGYQLLIPLMIVALASYLTTRIFITNSVYTFQLAQKGQLMTHHADKNILKLMDISNLLETDFKIIHPGQTLGDLVKIIQTSERNIFPVVDSNLKFKGMISMGDIRRIIFKQHLYNTIQVDSLMTRPSITVSPTESMQEIASKLHTSDYYNIPVIDETGQYLGFVSRANVFSEYRKLLKELSND